MPLVPQWFNRSLTALDSLLSARWGDASKSWVIQRKAYIPESELAFMIRQEARLRTLAFTPAKDAGDRKIYHDRQNWISCAEELASAQTGSRVIFTTKHLNHDVFKMLCQSDIQGYGGYARFADMVEKEEERAEAEKERVNTNKRAAINGEVHDILRFLTRKKGVLLDQNEQDLRYMLHGQRSTPDSPELLPAKEF